MKGTRTKPTDQTCWMGELSQDVRVGQDPVEDELADANQVPQVRDWENLSKDSLQADVKPSLDQKETCA